MFDSENVPEAKALVVMLIITLFLIGGLSACGGGDPEPEAPPEHTESIPTPINCNVIPRPVACL